MISEINRLQDECNRNYYLLMQHQFTLAQKMPEQYPYRSLLVSKQEQINNIFTVKEGEIPKQHTTPFPLKIYGRAQPQSYITAFLYFFSLPITPQKYISLLRDLDFQKKADSNIDNFSIVKDLGFPNIQLLYLSYKRVLIIAPRYFVYIRCFFQQKGDYYVITTSVPEEIVEKDKTKCEIILTVTRIKATQQGCQVSVYSQVDMRMKLKPDMAINNGSIEIAKYLKNFYNLSKTV